MLSTTSITVCCSTEQQPIDLVSIDISKCYPSILINKTRPIPVYIIHGKIGPFTHQCQLDKCGEFYMDETVNNNFRVSLKIEAGFYSSNLVWYLINELNTPTTNIKWKITTKKSLKLDTFRNFLTSIFDTGMNICFQKLRLN